MDTSTIVKGASMFLTGATLGTALTFGTINTFNSDDLTTLEQHVSEYQETANDVVDDLEKQWEVQIDDANAEIEDYQLALEQANGNILTLKEKASELNSAWTKISNSQKATISQLQQDVSDLEQDVSDLEQDNEDLGTNYNEELERLKQQQKQTDEENQAKIDALINQANAEIKKAEDEIKALKNQVVSNIEDDELTNYNRPQFDLDDEKEIYVENADLSINMPSIDDETTTPPTTEEGESGEVGRPDMGTVAYLEFELYNVGNLNTITVNYDGLVTEVYQQNGTNKFRIEVPLNNVTNSSHETLYIQYYDMDNNSISSDLVITGSVNGFVGEHNVDVVGLSDTGVQSLKVVVE